MIRVAHLQVVRITARDKEAKVELSNGLGAELVIFTRNRDRVPVIGEWYSVYLESEDGGAG